MTLRQIARHTAAAMGHRVLVGTPEYVADELEAWLKQDAADGFNVICNHYPKPLEDFCTMVVLRSFSVPGCFPARAYTAGTTLREHFGLRVPRSRYDNNQGR